MEKQFRIGSNVLMYIAISIMFDDADVHFSGMQIETAIDFSWNWNRFNAGVASSSAVVPEPATVLLLSGGLAGPAGAGTKRRKSGNRGA